MEIRVQCHSCPLRVTAPKVSASWRPKSFRTLPFRYCSPTDTGVRPAAAQYPPLIPHRVRERGPSPTGSRLGERSSFKSLKAHHGSVGFEPPVDLGALEAAEAEVLDGEAGDDRAVGHGPLEAGRVRLADRGEVAHEAPGEAVAGAGRID